MTKTVTILDEHDFDLEELCSFCQSIPPLRRPQTCEVCHGIGRIPTDLGQRILELVQRYLIPMTPAH